MDRSDSSRPGSRPGSRAGSRPRRGGRRGHGGHRVYRVCFVCTGNICRSPMAEAVCRAHLAARGLGERVVVDSAGTGSWHAGEGADPRAEAALAAAGYALTHSARQFRRGWFDRYDLVVALDRGHEHSLRRLAPAPADAARVRLLRAYDLTAVAAGELDVPDPYYGGDTRFASCLKLIEAAMPGLLDEIAEQLPGDGTPAGAAAGAGGAARVEDQAEDQQAEDQGEDQGENQGEDQEAR